MRKTLKNTKAVYDLLSSDAVDKKVSNKITNTSIMFAGLLFASYVLILFQAATIFHANLKLLKIFICVMPFVMSLFWGLSSLFTIQLSKHYFKDVELIQNTNNFKFFLSSLINPYILVVAITITAVMIILI